MLIKTDTPTNETYHDWLTRTSLEAEIESTKKGFLTTEKVEQRMAAHKHDFYKKQPKAA